MASVSWNTVDPPFSAGALGNADKKAAVLRHIAGSERLIDVRPASRLEVRPRPEMLSSGISALDALTGGLPRGCLTEIWGSASSGKTSALLAVLATATQRDESCVLIDASDSFDPSSGAKAGVVFSKLLWVRCGGSSALGRRSSAKPITAALQTFSESRFRPFAKDLRFSNNADDRRPFLACPARSEGIDGIQRSHPTRKYSSERRLEQVLKTTDLVLQSGGFGLVALDLAGISQKLVRRIPLASWFRFQRAVEHTKTALLVVSEFSCAQTCATLAIKLSAVSSQESVKLSHTRVLEGMQMEAEIVRSRLDRKPMQSVKATFESKAACAE